VAGRQGRGGVLCDSFRPKPWEGKKKKREGGGPHARTMKGKGAVAEVQREAPKGGKERGHQTWRAYYKKKERGRRGKEKSSGWSWREVFKIHSRKRKGSGGQDFWGGRAGGEYSGGGRGREGPRFFPYSLGKKKEGGGGLNDQSRKKKFWACWAGGEKGKGKLEGRACGLRKKEGEGREKKEGRSGRKKKKWDAPIRNEKGREAMGARGGGRGKREEGSPETDPLVWKKKRGKKENGLSLWGLILVGGEGRKKKKLRGPIGGKEADRVFISLEEREGEKEPGLPGKGRAANKGVR